MGARDRLQTLRTALLSRAADLKLPALDAAMKRWKETGGGDEIFSFDSGGETWWAGISGHDYGDGARLYVGVLIPESDFLADIGKQRNIALSAIVAGGVLTAVLLVLSTVGRVRRQIKQTVSQIERKLGQYRLKYKIGSGGNGDVYLARHALLRRPTAIKIMRPEFARSDSAKARFEHEVQITSGLTHPNTVAIYDFGKTPEIISAAGQASPASDLYALGAVAYYLLTGHNVFEGASTVEICAKHLHDAPVPPSGRAGSQLPADLEAQVLVCLEKDPAMRPRSAEALADRLRDCADYRGWSVQDARAWWQANQYELPLGEDQGEHTPLSNTALLVDMDERLEVLRRTTGQTIRYGPMSDERFRLSAERPHHNGTQDLDLLPNELPVGMVNRYLAIKRGAAPTSPGNPFDTGPQTKRRCARVAGIPYPLHRTRRPSLGSRDAKSAKAAD